MKKLVQFPNMVEILTPIYKKVNKLYNLSESIIPKGLEYTHNLLTDFKLALETKKMLNTKIKELIEGFILDIIELSKYNYANGTTWGGSNNRLKFGKKIRFMLESDDMYNEFKNFINSSDEYVELKKIVKDEDELVKQGNVDNQTSNQTN